jgi:hypothetical protein
MRTNWTEVADQETLDRLLPTLVRKKPPPKPLSVKVIKLPLRPISFEDVVSLEMSLGRCPKRDDARTVLHHYVTTCIYGYCTCTDPGYLQIGIRRYPGREYIDVEAPEPSCDHPGDWNDARVREYARGITEVRTLSDSWGQSRYPERQVWRAWFNCGDHP